MEERNLSDSKTAIFRYNANDKGYVLRDCVVGGHSLFSFEMLIPFSSVRGNAFLYSFINIYQ